MDHYVAACAEDLFRIVVTEHGKELGVNVDMPVPLDDRNPIVRVLNRDPIALFRFQQRHRRLSMLGNVLVCAVVPYDMAQGVLLDAYACTDVAHLAVPANNTVLEIVKEIRAPCLPCVFPPPV